MFFINGKVFSSYGNIFSINGKIFVYLWEDVFRLWEDIFQQWEGIFQAQEWGSRGEELQKMTIDPENSLKLLLDKAFEISILKGLVIKGRKKMGNYQIAWYERYLRSGPALYELDSLDVFRIHIDAAARNFIFDIKILIDTTGMR